LCIADKTFVDLSSKASVVPTGALGLPLPVLISAIDANFLPPSTNIPSRFNKVPLGSLKGSGWIDSLSDPPGASTSLNSPGCIGVSSSLILIPRVLNPAGKLARVPASIKLS
jgi:hypothetical protein